MRRIKKCIIKYVCVVYSFPQGCGKGVINWGKHVEYDLMSSLVVILASMLTQNSENVKTSENLV